MTYQPTICIITPTIGRPSLRQTLESVSLANNDHWIVVGDGPNTQARAIWASVPTRGYYTETLTAYGDYGNALRDRAMMWATQDYLIFLDDDDVIVPGGIDIIKHEIKEHYPRPIIFKMRNGNGEILWKNREVTPGNVGAAMFCCPNRPDTFGKWTNGAGHRSDYEFIMATLKSYGPAWRQNIFWSDKVTVHCRPGEVATNG